MKKAVLFDLDGTLWHTCDVILPVWNDILKKHKETTKQITLEEMNSYMGKTVEQIASIMLPELTLENSVAIVKECCAEQIPSLRKTGGHLYDNLESTLEILSKNYFLGIISNCQCGYIEAFLFAHKLEKYFSDFEMSGRTNMTKGENIKLVMERNSIDKAVCISAIQSVISLPPKMQKYRSCLHHTDSAQRKIPNIQSVRSMNCQKLQKKFSADCQKIG